ncbi:Uncharacterized conserved protein [uncultured Clostridium sp.]|uniref:terminase small subunit n=1 Tax=uncultured Clostridium sp. TaxID=59620 RepID=UPI00082115B3|nr:terminase small subunit [uncultured Clostridium sp.]SCJ52511.1 Uncharacterized conserved protein [uncultured Clostridium sp.]
MARAPNEKLNKAYALYQKGYKLIDIAKELDIPVGTIRSWKNRYSWDDKCNATLKKNKRNVANKKTNKNNREKVAIAEEIIEVIGNAELTDKQRLFCVIYAKCMNATKAYQKAYTCTYETAMVSGSRLLRNDKIKKQIDELIACECNKEFLKRGLIQKYIDIAFSDIGDFVKFGKKTKGAWTKDNNGIDIPVIDPETGEQKVIEYSYMELKESSMVDTTLIGEISEGKDGIKIKLLDKLKAMDFLSKHANLLNDEEKVKLDIEYKTLQNRKLETEITRLKALIEGNNEDEEIEDDGFIAALGNKVAEVWANEEDS